MQIIIITQTTQSDMQWFNTIHIRLYHKKD